MTDSLLEQPPAVWSATPHERMIGGLEKKRRREHHIIKGERKKEIKKRENGSRQSKFTRTSGVLSIRRQSKLHATMMFSGTEEIRNVSQIDTSGEERERKRGKKKKREENKK